MYLWQNSSKCADVSGSIFEIEKQATRKNVQQIYLHPLESLLLLKSKLEKFQYKLNAENDEMQLIHFNSLNFDLFVMFYSCQLRVEN